MNHSLTDEIILSIWLKAEDEKRGGPTQYDLMRAAADWRLEQVIEWLEDYTKTVEFLKHPQYVVTELKKAMRPQEES